MTKKSIIGRMVAITIAFVLVMAGFMQAWPSGCIGFPERAYADEINPEAAPSGQPGDGAAVEEMGEGDAAIPGDAGADMEADVSGDTGKETPQDGVPAAGPEAETGTGTGAVADPGPAPAGSLITPFAVGDNEWFNSKPGGVSPYNIDTSWLHYRSDGAVAYCRQKGLNNPDGTSGDYTLNAWEPGEQSKMAGLFASADQVASKYGVTGDYKRALVQMCIWTITHDYEPYNPSIGSVTSTSPSMLAALHDLHDAAQAGYTQQAASINILDHGDKLVASGFSDEYARYGPFIITGAKRAQISVANAPAGSYIGDLFGDVLDKNNLPNDKWVFLYIPCEAGATASPKVTVTAQFDTVTVIKYSGFSGYQDQIVGSKPGSGEITKTYTCFGFGAAEIWKHDDEDYAVSLSGARFDIYVWSKSTKSWNPTKLGVYWDDKTRRYRTDVLSENDDNEGRYRIVEVSAPYSYLSGWSAEINVRSQYGAHFIIHADNKPVKLAINLYKNDRSTGDGIPQGDASLGGAVYGLYMNEDREHPGGTKYTKGQKIAEGVTDENGMAVFSGLFPAKYYIKEISPSEGYLLDTAVYEIDGVHDGVSVSIARDIVVTEQVKKQKFELIKVGTSENETEVSLLEAGFKVYLVSELSGVKDGSLLPKDAFWSYKDFKGYDFTDENTAMIDGACMPELFTDSLGHLVSPEFPYGKYVVVESTTPEGYLTIDPFIVTVSEDSRDAQPWRVFDDKEMRFYIRVVKKDSETGNTVLKKSAAYRIFDLEKGEYVSMKTTYPKAVWHGTEDSPFRTDDTGTLITPEKLAYGHYRLDEVVAPDGYVLSGNEQFPKAGYNPKGDTIPKPNGPVYIEFSECTPVYVSGVDADVIEVIQYNEQQKGRIYIDKQGDKPGGVSVGADGNMSFGYGKGPLEGVKFAVIADGDIVSQDGSGTVLYAGGDAVSTLVTDENGRAWSEDLYIGNYILREVDAPEGYIFVPDERFQVTSTDQKKQYTFFTRSLTDARQRLDIVIIKSDKKTGALLKDAEFCLYAMEAFTFGDPPESARLFSGLADLFTGERFNTIEKDSLVMTAISGKDGRAVFTGLPPGRYYVTEKKAPKGYELNKSFRAEFTLAYDKAGGEVLTWTDTCMDSKTPSKAPKTPAPKTPAPKTPAPKGSVPKTGDGFSPVPFIAVAAGAGIALIILVRRMKKDGMK